MTETVRLGRKHTNRHRLGDRHGWICQHCGKRVHCHVCEPNRPNVNRATRDHLVARSRGGFGADNIVLACWRCNHTKADSGYNVPKPGKMTDPSRCPKREAHPRSTGRLKYGTQEAAEAMCREVERKWGRTVIAYNCRHCHEWHIGKQATV